jgi:hypothetical protein
MKHNLRIFFFHGPVKELEERAGFKHEESFKNYSMSMIMVIQKQIFESGLNTMLLHQKDNNILLMIDDKRFRFR